MPASTRIPQSPLRGDGVFLARISHGDAAYRDSRPAMGGVIVEKWGQAPVSGHGDAVQAPDQVPVPIFLRAV